ncbi:hypothetical protein [Ruegeria arenilitoris]|uniref:hypothetical protein n=1 Tax=Ruegeria arenilitoris TaxID=1173585 RepID=UPI00147FA5D1|nr:hypothetical protein [Ruegeria arenilitoris]
MFVNNTETAIREIDPALAAQTFEAGTKFATVIQGWDQDDDLTPPMEMQLTIQQPCTIHDVMNAFALSGQRYLDGKKAVLLDVRFEEVTRNLSTGVFHIGWGTWWLSK